MRTITDMAGRNVIIPDEIKKVYAPSPYGSAALYSLVPELMAGRFFEINESQKEYLLPSFIKLPRVGKFNEIEAIKSADPDLILVWKSNSELFHPKAEEAMKVLKIPYIYVSVDDLVSLKDYPAAYRFLGKVFNREERAESLAKYCEKAVIDAENIVNLVHPQYRPKVYYAEENDGLSTEYSQSLHAYLLELCGDVNIHRGRLSGHRGMERITADYLKEADPDIILCMSKEFFQGIKNREDLKGIKAINNNKVYLIPSLPFSWFDRPPTYMRLIGLKWLLTILYPQHCSFNLMDEIIKFFKLFNNQEITYSQASQLVKQNLI